MTNLLEQAINCNDGDLAAKIIRDALGIENDDVTNYCFPKDWPDTKEQLVYALQKLSNAERSFSGRSAYLAIASDVLGYPAMLVDPFFGFRLGKKLAKKVLSVRPRHFDAPITFPRNRLKRCRIHESSPVIPIMRRFPEIFNESDPDRSGLEATGRIQMPWVRPTWFAAGIAYPSGNTPALHRQGPRPGRKYAGRGLN